MGMLYVFCRSLYLIGGRVAGASGLYRPGPYFYGFRSF
jgi:hypothetical protein